MKRTLLIGGLFVVGCLLLAVGSEAQTIVGSAHDFSGNPWSGGQICLPCHTPHFADTSVIYAPLWNHEVTVATYTLYSSITLDATDMAQPDATSKLCLSCHDGTVAIDSFGGATGTNFISPGANVGTDLSNDHPISFSYDTTLATNDGALFDPATEIVTIGSGGFTRTGSITDVMLFAGRLECSSCHDVHNNFVAGGIGGQPLLKISKLSSDLCLACHNR